MSSEVVVAAVEEGWVIRHDLGGIDRVSGTELGRRLEYNVNKPTQFNKAVVGKLLNDGKFSNFDIVPIQGQCRKGFGFVPLTEYWLTLPVARSIALEHVWTPRAVKLRKLVVEQLESLMSERASALQAPTPDYAALALAVQQQTQILQQHTEILESLRLPKAPPSIYIDEERVHLLKRLAQDITAARGEGSVQSIWQGLQRTSFVKAKQGAHPRVFATVTIDRFDAILAQLRADLEKALSAPNRSVTSLLARRVASSGNSLDTEEASARLRGVGIDVPSYAMADLYEMAGTLTYEPEETKGTNVHIDDSSIRPLIAWCTAHSRALEVFLRLQKKLHEPAKASTGKRRGATGGE